jgi:hydroxymethylglutaryl-CoA lyase
VSEVGPRDGLQAIKRTMPTAAKIAWIEALAASGIPEIEVGSFVNPKLLPQMADTAELVAAARRLKGVDILVLVPNLKGAERAFAAGADKVTMPVSASRSHSKSNINMTPEEAVAQVAAVCALRDAMPKDRRPRVEAGISTAFGCTMEGQVSEDFVIELALMLAKAAADVVNMADTTGMGNPAQVKRLFKRLKAELGPLAGAAHLHNTRGQGLANVVGALEAGVTTFDSSQAGLGGCPYAPGATGNIVTEDLVFLLESMGLRTGIDMDKLIAARAVILAGLPGETLYGHIPDVGYPKGFVLAKDARA